MSFMRNFMDELCLRRVPGGGMEVVMVKTVGESSP